MLKVLKISMITGCILASSAAMANSGYYISGKVGASMEAFSQQKYSDIDTTGLFKDEYGNWGSKRKTTFNLGVQSGYNLKSSYNLPIRLELDYTYRGEAKPTTTSDIYYTSGAVVDAGVELKIKTTLHTLMFNTYYDIDTGSAFTPYLSAGIGASVIDATFGFNFPNDTTVEGGSISKTKTKFAWAVGLGVSYNLSQNVDLDLGYRYLNAGKITIDNSYDAGSESLSAKIATHDVSLGLRYSF